MAETYDKEISIRKEKYGRETNRFYRVLFFVSENK